MAKTGWGGRRAGAGRPVATLRFHVGDQVRLQRHCPDGDMAPETGIVERVEYTLFGWTLTLTLPDGERITLARTPGRE